MILFLCILSLILPNPGSIYNQKINFPFIGSQLIETEIITNNFASIKLEGIINDKGNIKYISYNDKNILIPSRNIKKIINKYNIEITYISYDDIYDSINFNINIKFINYKSKIKMKRLN